MAVDWEELPDPVQADVMNALSKDTDDKAGQEALASAWHAAEAVEQFCGVLESLRMELDEISGQTGEVRFFFFRFLRYLLSINRVSECAFCFLS